jgi:hypothetical protein
LRVEYPSRVIIMPQEMVLPECQRPAGRLGHPCTTSVRRDVSRLHPGRTGGSFEYAHVLSHMSEMGGAGISALLYLLYYTANQQPLGATVAASDRRSLVPLRCHIAMRVICIRETGRTVLQVPNLKRAWALITSMSG